MKVLVTGAAGFVGSHTAGRLLAAGHEVHGVDVINPSQADLLRRQRLADADLRQDTGTYSECTILEQAQLQLVFDEFRPDAVVHLAARAGVRSSVLDPEGFKEVNVAGTEAVLACSEAHEVSHLVFASSSSVYGEASSGHPTSEGAGPGRFLSPYARTKWEAEERIRKSALAPRCTILRLFTVYGPRGRPDMMPSLFARAIMRGETLELHENTSRDFTFISDVVDAIEAVLQRDPTGLATYNVANGQPWATGEFLEVLARELGARPQVKVSPKPRELPASTIGDASALRCALGWTPKVGLEQGVARFASWYRSFLLSDSPPGAGDAG